MSAYYDDREVFYSDLLRARETRDPRFASLVVRYLEQSDPPEHRPEEPTATLAASSDTEADGASGDRTGIRSAGTWDTGDDGAAEDEDGDYDEDEDGDYDADEDYDDEDEDYDDEDEDYDGDSASSTATDSALPADAWTLNKLRSVLAPHNLYGKTADEKKALRREAWDALMAAPHPPPRLRLGGLLIELYDAGDEWSRAQVLEILGQAKVGWGLWRGIKRIYKLAEERHDASVIGLVAWRLDASYRTGVHHGEVSPATFAYMRRRVWRYLRQLGQTLPELYPQFAVQVLRHYPPGFSFGGTWIAAHIWAHEELEGARTAYITGPPDKLERRAFDDAWKLSPEPLLRLLEDAGNNSVCEFAIRSLRSDFPAALRDVDPRWLARIGAKELATVDGFVVELLQANPEFHQSRLRALGLHEVVISLLRSDNGEAAAYAVDYAKAHAPDIPISDLIDIASSGSLPARELVRARLGQKTPAEIGLPLLVRMLAVRDLVKLAQDKLHEGYRPEELTAELYIALAGGERAQQKFVHDFYKQHGQKVPAAFLIARLSDEGLHSWDKRKVLEELGKRKAREIGVDWIKSAVLEPDYGDQVAAWLRKGMLKGKELDVDWLKGLVMRPRMRALAIELLGNRKLVAPLALGLPWLLSMARQADESLSSFAHRYLLENFEPDDFALEAGSTDAGDGITKLWSLLDRKLAEPVRRFAATYLRVHHPDAGPATGEAKQLGIKPKLEHTAYALERLRPLFEDASADVRAMARAVARCELMRWQERDLLYQFAASAYREGRTMAAEVLLHIGEPDADAARVPPAEWLIPHRVFALAESPIKATREVALTLIRRHYARLGGADKLGWLMESPDREVRLFAVRLLWEKHRPVAAPARAAAHGRFETTAALQQFLRTVLFGLPPGRMERRERIDQALPDRPLSASIAKGRLVEVVRDMALEDRGFAEVIIPVLEEFMHSRAKGEWQACVAALAQIRHTHPDVITALPAALPHAPSPA